MLYIRQVHDGRDAKLLITAKIEKLVVEHICSSKIYQSQWQSYISSTPILLMLQHKMLWHQAPRQLDNWIYSTTLKDEVGKTILKGGEPYSYLKQLPINT